MSVRPLAHFVPRNGLVALILLVVRVSDPKAGDKSSGKQCKQDVRSLDDQEHELRAWIDANVDCQHEIRVIGSRGKGEHLDREELQELYELVATGQFDLVLTEDSGRIVRRIHSHLFFEHCRDYGTRVVSLRDHVDTDEEGWEDLSIISGWHHERSNRDTSNRIKRTLRNRFMLDEAEQLPIFGQIRPEGAKSMADWHKDPAAEPVYKKWFQMLDDGATFGEVADWLNANAVPVGPYCRNKRWDSQMVARLTYNPMLKGLRTHNKTISVRNSRGKYISEKAPPDLVQYRELPHLAFIEPAEYDRIIAKLRAKNARYSRKSRINGKDIRTGVPRKKTRFPGQMVVCGICGRPYKYEGSVSNDRLMCRGASEYLCWNSVGLSGSLTTEKVLEAILTEVERLPDWDDELLATVQEEALKLDEDRERRLQQLADEELDGQRKRANLVKFIAEGDISSAVREQLAATEKSLTQIAVDRQRLEQQPRQTVDIPPIIELKRLAREALTDIDRSDPEFQAVMRHIVPRLVVFPHLPCDGGLIVPRVRFRWSAAGILSNPRQRELLSKPTEIVSTVDVFTPPDRVLALPQVMSHTDLSKPGIEALLGIRQHTVKQARKLWELMQELGISDPYVPLLDPPDTQLKRHRHPRYRFEPLPGAGEV